MFESKLLYSDAASNLQTTVTTVIIQSVYLKHAHIKHVNLTGQLTDTQTHGVTSVVTMRLQGVCNEQATVFGTVVTCPPPENIDRGYSSKDDQRTYNYMETVKYGCLGDFVLEGSLETVCQQNGMWSEKPSCKGRSSTNNVPSSF